MKKVIFHTLQHNLVAIVAVCTFVVMGSMHHPGPASTGVMADNSCGNGYSVPLAKVRQFMVDSLTTRRYEGGIFKKSDLMMMLDSMKSDTVYILNGMFGCNFARGTGLAITSPRNPEVAFLGWYSSGYCYPCPFRACCPKKFCVINTRRDCATYLPYSSGPSVSHDTQIETVEE